MFLLVHRK